MSQQASTPTLTFSSTEACADAEPSISANADQLNSIPRRLQKHSKSWLQCWVIVNSTGGKSSTLVSLSRINERIIFLIVICLFSLVFSRSRLPVLTSPPAPVRIPVSSQSPVPRQLSHGSTAPHEFSHGSTVFPVQFPRSPHSSSVLSGNSHGPSIAAIQHSPRSRSTARRTPVSRASRHLTSSPKNPCVRCSPKLLNRPRACICLSSTAWLFGSLLVIFHRPGFPRNHTSVYFRS